MGVDKTDQFKFLTFEDVINGMKSGLESVAVEKFQVLGFDACLMAGMEMLPMLVPFADFLIASEELEPGHGWNYAFLDRVFEVKNLQPVDLAKLLWDSFFNEDLDGSQMTLGVIELSKVAPFVAAVDAVALLLEAELDHDEVVRAFVHATESAEINVDGVTLLAGKMGMPDFADFGNFLQRLAATLPRGSVYASTTYDTLAASINQALAMQRQMFVVERHTDGMPFATGLNVYLPEDTFSWNKYSKLYYKLYGYEHYLRLIKLILGLRTGDITDSVLATDRLSWQNTIAAIAAGPQNLTVSRSLTDSSVPHVAGAALRIGISSGSATYYLGAVPAQVDSESGAVVGAWDYRLLTLSNSEFECATYHEWSANGVVRFIANLYQEGACCNKEGDTYTKKTRVFGTYSIDTQRWNLFANSSAGVAAIAPREGQRAWVVPLVQDEAGHQLETPDDDCRETLIYSK